MTGCQIGRRRDLIFLHRKNLLNPPVLALPPEAHTQRTAPCSRNPPTPHPRCPAPSHPLTRLLLDPRGASVASQCRSRWRHERAQQQAPDPAAGNQRGGLCRGAAGGGRSAACVRAGSACASAAQLDYRRSPTQVHRASRRYRDRLRGRAAFFAAYRFAT
jgi:hypothetical protein